MTTTKQLTWGIDDEQFYAITYLRGYLESPFSFEETVARLITLSGQDPTADGYKVSVEFVGMFGGQPFTLYDYKEDRKIHIGGNDKLDVEGLAQELLVKLSSVEPTPYRVKEYYDQEQGHGFPN